ncbi:MAG: conjugal transfer protein TraN, partial [Burkholderiales bacterium]|nr:conjugal transfer protein TraN [Burkholderiales bacterium]
GCIERAESYCCYNSRLARIIQEQGRDQINKSWGSAKNPDCSGFLIEELESLDFETMDLGEFEEEIRAQAELN